jgi:hypothetical protein
VLSVEVQARLALQPFPPVPRQPTVHLLTAASHTRPESTAPQSVSVAQPQVISARQAAPLPVARQLPVLAAVHSTHSLLPVSLHTDGLVQSASTKHCTQTCGVGVVSHLTSGAEVQSVSVVQGCPRQLPTPPD